MLVAPSLVSRGNYVLDESIGSRAPILVTRTGRFASPTVGDPYEASGAREGELLERFAP
jgi:hypothetical protein